MGNFSLKCLINLFKILMKILFVNHLKKMKLCTLIKLQSDSIDSVTNIFAGGWGLMETLMEWLTRNKNFIAKENFEHDFTKNIS